MTGPLDRARYLREAIGKATKAAHQAYQFNPGSYTCEVLIQIDAPQTALGPVLELMEADQ
jgi:hypothetical protein